ncbi:MAG: dihydrofolate reductase family protein [Pseudomonadota bacterium]
MSIRFSVFIATSLDGFIARLDGNLDWLIGATDSTDDHGYADFMADIDALAMGRNTFETALTFGEWPYAGRRVVVFSRTLTRQALPAALADTVELFSGSVAELAGHLERSGARSVYVDGGQLIQGFLRAGLIGEITLTRIPVLLGSGISLFGPVPQDIQLEHVRTRAYESGFVQSTYRVIGNLPAFA